MADIERFTFIGTECDRCDGVGYLSADANGEWVRYDESLSRALAEARLDRDGHKAGEAAIAWERDELRHQLAESERLSAARNKLNGELAMENDRLREALRKYGWHLLSCDKVRYSGEGYPCTCNFDAALTAPATAIAPIQVEVKRVECPACGGFAGTGTDHECTTCNGRGEIGGFDAGDNAYRTEPCLDCTTASGGAG
jgi:hypothetical protein